METLSPLVNLIALFSVLSLAAERATNVLKLRRPDLRTPNRGEDEADLEKDREKGVTQICLGVSILVAVLVKANIFEIMTHLDAPWDTLGWLHIRGSEWFRGAALSGWSQFFYALGGSAITGFALGFGSKFWHESLDIVFNTRTRLKKFQGA